MPTPDPHTRVHLEWLGFIQPNGLVVSAPAMVKAGAILNRHDVEGQESLEAWLNQRDGSPARPREESLQDFRVFAKTVLGWGFSPKGYAGTEETPIPAELEVPLPDYGETLRPDFAVRERDPQAGELPWQLVVQVLDKGNDLDKSSTGAGGLETSPQGRMERLLRATGVPAGALFNGTALRLVSAPRGESSGWMDFRVADMAQTAGRPLCAALRLLLCEQRLLTGPKEHRLAALLADSRRYQNEVSERLSEQVMHALYDLLRGFQAAHDESRGELLREPLFAEGDPNDIYRGLLAVILRLVFLLYAEERGMLPGGETFIQHYSVGGLYQRLREEAALHPDTMDQRYGAWAQLLVLFRLIHDGAGGHKTGGIVSLPERRGALFNPDRYPFLEGRHSGGGRQITERVQPPRVSDGAVYRVLEKLVVLDGERISYRTLDVEQIGSVYEVIMGFRLETATGRSVAVKSGRKLGAPSTVDIDELAKQPKERRGKWLQDRVDRTLTETVKKGLHEADTVDDLHLALDRVLDKNATPDLVTPGSLVLQPSDERRRSGSNYTPRELTEPIVRHTLEPLLDRLRDEEGGVPTPARILELKICDPAMGSGAFLVETCRQLADALIEAWRAHDETPVIPPDEDEVVHARRLVARKCLYGIDRNPMAVDLAKTSLWLSTLARDHPLTFLDHAFRHGDSLVGLTRKQVEAFHWIAERPPEEGFEIMRVREHMTELAALRQCIRDAGEDVSDQELHDIWQNARDELGAVRLYGDLALAAFFAETKRGPREGKRREFAAAAWGGQADRYLGWIGGQRGSDPPLAPLHWELEFPEVFERENPGFDAFVGNPPFAGKNNVAAGNVVSYPDWLKTVHLGSHGNADLVAHFYRRAFNLLREGGAFGLIATNTIAQGDTRSTGLRWICENGGQIYRATKRVKWPGDAAVVVSVLHVAKGKFAGTKVLDGRDVENITAFLFHKGGHADPARLEANAGKSFQGSIVLGMGFTFDDTDKKGVANPLSEMRRLIEADPHNGERIFPYIGGEEVNTSPTHAHHRYVINFEDFPLRREDLGKRWADAGGDLRRAWLRRGVVPLDYPEPVAADWPELLGIVEERVKSDRSKLTKNPIGRKRAEFWWRYGSTANELYAASAGLDQVLAINCGATPHLAVTFLLARTVFAHTLAVFPLDTYAAFCTLQSRLHETWARFYGSTLEDRLRYTPSDCFETFPFPDGWETLPALDAAGETYCEHRATLMIKRNEGMTKTYNRFHDPYEDDPAIVRLRELHAAMDRAVLDAYGWTDIPTDCDFLLDYEIDEATWGAKKKPYRYRWPDESCDEVLARLLALNAERSEEEARARLVQKPVPKIRHRVLMVAEQASLWDRPMTDQTPQRFTPLVKRSRPKPSTIYPVLWRFACERQRIYLRRVAGDPSPWTTDTVLSEYKFTNAFRAADRVSQYLIHLIYSDPKASGATLFLRALLFKVFNKIETWDRVVNGLGMPVAHEFDYAACDDLLVNLRRQGAPIYSAAYIMPSGGRAGMPKHQMHLRLIRRMLDERLPEKLQESKSLAEAYEMVLSYPTLGPFLAFQYVIDLNYSTLLNHSEQKFVVAGPGALDGLSKCFESLGEYSAADAILWLSDIQADEFARYGLDFEGLWGRPLQPIDVQNLFCEVSKYTRVTHPEIRGRTVRKRIKQRFAMTGPLPKPFFPPKWGLNQRIDDWLTRRTGVTLQQPELFFPSPARPR